MKSTLRIYVVLSTILILKASTAAEPLLSYPNSQLPSTSGQYYSNQHNVLQPDFKNGIQPSHFQIGNNWASRDYQNSGNTPKAYDSNTPMIQSPIFPQQANSNNPGTFSASGDPYTVQSSQTTDSYTNPSKFKIFHLPISPGPKTLQLPLSGATPDIKVVQINRGDAINGNEHNSPISNYTRDALFKAESAINKIESNIGSYVETDITGGNQLHPQQNNTPQSFMDTSIGLQNQGYNGGNPRVGYNNDLATTGADGVHGNQGHNGDQSFVSNFYSNNYGQEGQIPNQGASNYQAPATSDSTTGIQNDNSVNTFPVAYKPSSNINQNLWLENNNALATTGADGVHGNQGLNGDQSFVSNIYSNNYGQEGQVPNQGASNYQAPATSDSTTGIQNDNSVNTFPVAYKPSSNINQNLWFGNNNALATTGADGVHGSQGLNGDQSFVSNIYSNNYGQEGQVPNQGASNYQAPATSDSTTGIQNDNSVNTFPVAYKPSSNINQNLWLENNNALATTGADGVHGNQGLNGDQSFVSNIYSNNYGQEGQVPNQGASNYQAPATSDSTTGIQNDNSVNTFPVAYKPSSNINQNLWYENNNALATTGADGVLGNQGLNGDQSFVSNIYSNNYGQEGQVPNQGASNYKAPAISDSTTGIQNDNTINKFPVAHKPFSNINQNLWFEKEETPDQQGNIFINAGGSSTGSNFGIQNSVNNSPTLYSKSPFANQQDWDGKQYAAPNQIGTGNSNFEATTETSTTRIQNFANNFPALNSPPRTNVDAWNIKQDVKPNQLENIFNNDGSITGSFSSVNQILENSLISPYKSHVANYQGWNEKQEELPLPPSRGYLLNNDNSIKGEITSPIKVKDNNVYSITQNYGNQDVPYAGKMYSINHNKYQNPETAAASTVTLQGQDSKKSEMPNLSPTISYPIHSINTRNPIHKYPIHPNNLHLPNFGNLVNNLPVSGPPAPDRLTYPYKKQPVYSHLNLSKHPDGVPFITKLASEQSTNNSAIIYPTQGRYSPIRNTVLYSTNKRSAADGSSSLKLYDDNSDKNVRTESKFPFIDNTQRIDYRFNRDQQPTSFTNKFAAQDLHPTQQETSYNHGEITSAANKVGNQNNFNYNSGITQVFEQQSKTPDYQESKYHSGRSTATASDSASHKSPTIPIQTYPHYQRHNYLHNQLHGHTRPKLASSLENVPVNLQSTDASALATSSNSQILDPSKPIAMQHFPQSTDLMAGPYDEYTKIKSYDDKSNENNNVLGSNKNLLGTNEYETQNIPTQQGPNINPKITPAESSIRNINLHDHRHQGEIPNNSEISDNRHNVNDIHNYFTTIEPNTYKYKEVTPNIEKQSPVNNNKPYNFGNKVNSLGTLSGNLYPIVNIQDNRHEINNLGTDDSFVLDNDKQALTTSEIAESHDEPTIPVSNYFNSYVTPVKLKIPSKPDTTAETDVTSDFVQNDPDHRYSIKAKNPTIERTGLQHSFPTINIPDNAPAPTTADNFLVSHALATQTNKLLINENIPLTIPQYPYNFSNTYSRDRSYKPLTSSNDFQSHYSDKPALSIHILSPPIDPKNLNNVQPVIASDTTIPNSGSWLRSVENNTQLKTPYSETVRANENTFISPDKPSTLDDTTDHPAPYLDTPPDFNYKEISPIPAANKPQNTFDLLVNPIYLTNRFSESPVLMTTTEEYHDNTYGTMPTPKSPSLQNSALFQDETNNDTDAHILPLSSGLSEQSSLSKQDKNQFSIFNLLSTIFDTESNDNLIGSEDSHLVTPDSNQYKLNSFKPSTFPSPISPLKDATNTQDKSFNRIISPIISPTYISPSLPLNNFPKQHLSSTQEKKPFSFYNLFNSYFDDASSQKSNETIDNTSGGVDDLVSEIIERDNKIVTITDSLPAHTSPLKAVTNNQDSLFDGIIEPTTSDTDLYVSLPSDHVPEPLSLPKPNEKPFSIYNLFGSFFDDESNKKPTTLDDHRSKILDYSLPKINKKDKNSVNDEYFRHPALNYDPQSSFKKDLDYNVSPTIFKTDSSVTLPLNDLTERPLSLEQKKKPFSFYDLFGSYFDDSPNQKNTESDDNISAGSNNNKLKITTTEATIKNTQLSQAIRSVDSQASPKDIQGKKYFLKGYPNYNFKAPATHSGTTTLPFYKDPLEDTSATQTKSLPSIIVPKRPLAPKEKKKPFSLFNIVGSYFDNKSNPSQETNYLIDNNTTGGIKDSLADVENIKKTNSRDSYLDLIPESSYPTNYEKLIAEKPTANIIVENIFTKNVPSHKGPLKVSSNTQTTAHPTHTLSDRPFTREQKKKPFSFNNLFGSFFDDQISQNTEVNDNIGGGVDKTLSKNEMSDTVAINDGYLHGQSGSSYPAYLNNYKEIAEEQPTPNVIIENVFISNLPSPIGPHKVPHTFNTQTMSPPSNILSVQTPSPQQKKKTTEQKKPFNFLKLFGLYFDDDSNQKKTEAHDDIGSDNSLSLTDNRYETTVTDGYLDAPSRSSYSTDSGDDNEIVAEQPTSKGEVQNIISSLKNLFSW